MQGAFITPIQIGSLTSGLTGTGRTGTAGARDSVPFKDVFLQAIEDVKTTQKDLEQQQYLLSTGQIDDAHTVPVAAAKAQLSVDLLVTLRQKALEAYNELIRLNV